VLKLSGNFIPVGDKDVLDRLILGASDKTEEVIVRGVTKITEDALKKSGANLQTVQIDNKPASTWITEKADILAKACRGLEADIKNLENKNIRECLKVIHFLIDTTIKYKDLLDNEIPGVGGDIYLATVTGDKGFVYRSLDDVSD